MKRLSLLLLAGAAILTFNACDSGSGENEGPDGSSKTRLIKKITTDSRIMEFTYDSKDRLTLMYQYEVNHGGESLEWTFKYEENKIAVTEKGGYEDDPTRRWEDTYEITLNEKGYAESVKKTWTADGDSDERIFTVSYYSGDFFKAYGEDDTEYDIMEWKDGNITKMTPFTANWDAVAYSTKEYSSTRLNKTNLDLNWELYGLNYMVMDECPGWLNITGVVGKRSKNLIVDEVFSPSSESIRTLSYTFSYVFDKDSWPVKVTKIPNDEDEENVVFTIEYTNGTEDPLPSDDFYYNPYKPE